MDEAADAGFSGVVGIERREGEDGTAVAELHVEDRHLNGYGTVHGGAIATLVDVAMGYAVASSDDAKAPATIEMKVTYLEPAGGERLVAKATVRRRGKRITIVEADVVDGDSNEAVSHAIATFTTVG